MRIGIDCRTILNPIGSERAGVGHYTYYLVKNLLSQDQKNTYVLFFDSRFKNIDEFKQENSEIVFFPFYQYREYLPIAYSQMLISAVLGQRKLDVFHSPANIIPLFYNRPSVVTIHDLAIYKYPRFFPARFLSRQIFSTKVLVPKSLEKATKIIAVSKNTKTDIIEEFGIPEEKIEVIYEGVAIDQADRQGEKVDFSQIREKYGIGEKYIFFLGTIEPRKNIVSLIKAFRNLLLVYDSPAKDYQLIIAGTRGWSDQPIYEAIADANASIVGVKRRRGGKGRRSGLDKRSEAKRKRQSERRSGKERRTNQPIKYIGYVPHQEKMALLRYAICFVFPSLYEGFGLPVLEAMSVGTPVITSNVSSLPEIVGEKGGLLIDPTKESEITEALQQVLTDVGLRESLSVLGRKRAKEFSWQECAQKTLAVYQRVASEKK